MLACSVCLHMALGVTTRVSLSIYIFYIFQLHISAGFSLLILELKFYVHVTVLDGFSSKIA